MKVDLVGAGLDGEGEEMEVLESKGAERRRKKSRHHDQITFA